MKLRNKKTGEIIDGCFVVCKYDDGARFSVKDKPVFDSFAELNEDWEDYTPQEPLIKDEKIRKAVRAWASCNLLNNDDKVYITKPTFDCKILSLGHGMLDFDVYYDDESLCNKHYTIAELCGEEE